MKKLKLTKIIASTLVAASVLALNPIGASAEWSYSIRYSSKGFWYTEGDSWATGWRNIDGKWYYFDSDGYSAKEGWKLIDGKWYFFDHGDNKSVGNVRAITASGGVFVTKAVGSQPAMVSNMIVTGDYYYINSDGVWIENPTGEVKVYLDLLKDDKLMKQLKIINYLPGQVSFEGSSRYTTVDDFVYPPVILTDTDKDGILEMHTTSRFDLERIVTYRNGIISVYDKSNNYISSYNTNKESTETLTNVVKETSDVKVGRIVLNKTDLTVVKGNTSKLKATITPNDASNKEVKWTTSDNEVATVDSDGKITGVSEGAVIIKCTVKDGSGRSAACNVIVTDNNDETNPGTTYPPVD